MTTAWLSFSLRVARSAQDLHDACAVRAAAYGHHLPQLRAALAQPDAVDRHPGTVVLLCRDKDSGRPIGTARVQRCAPKSPVEIEHDVTLPDWLSERPRAEVSRLAIMPGADAMLRPMLIKASFLFCAANQIRWMVIGARSEALVRIYRRLGFIDAFDHGAALPLAHGGGLPHHILALDIVGTERSWYQGQHGLYTTIFETFHPDVQLFDTPGTAQPAERIAA
ncbi:hypothetical protein HLB44_13280 [Aquincola sp. S2]|uniref:GNAT family N-acetyltransferase n=1 Tax=Pseudaquabacterium terrae TaxID=2732868 RepID=A0ABX2EH95_9BURK|nr:hypothetical protein [Aquabacterium terrae]NRF67959.1 hypothetical protein [Aquabacterium terrae]